jgi:hypothetical protein
MDKVCNRMCKVFFTIKDWLMGFLITYLVDVDKSLAFIQRDLAWISNMLCAILHIVSLCMPLSTCGTCELLSSLCMYSKLFADANKPLHALLSSKEIFKSSPWWLWLSWPKVRARDPMASLKNILGHTGLHTCLLESTLHLGASTFYQHDNAHMLPW